MIHMLRDVNRILLQVCHDGSDPIISVRYSDGTTLNLLGKYLRFTEMRNFFLQFTEPKNIMVKLAQDEALAKSTGKLKKFTR